MSSQPSPTPPNTIPIESLQKEKYIRTYAMDLARVSGQAPANGATSATSDPAQDKKGFFNNLKTSLNTAPSAPVVTEDPVNESLIVHHTDADPQSRELADLEKDAEKRDAQAAIAEKEISAELSSLATEKAEPINIPAIQAKPSTTSTSKPFIKIPTTTTPEPVSMPQRVASDAEPSRESILERLRNKASQKKSDFSSQTLNAIPVQKIESDSAPAPKAPEPVVKEKIVAPAPLPTLEPVQTHEIAWHPAVPELPHPAATSEVPVVAPSMPISTRDENPVIIPTPALAPLPVPTPVVAPILPPIASVPVPAPTPTPAAAPFHSFSTDFADRVDEKKASTFSVLAAEKDSAPKARPIKRKTEWLPIIAGIILILAGAIGVLLAYHFMQKTTPTQSSETIPSLINADQTVALTGTDLSAALDQQASQAIPDGQVVLTYIKLPETTAAGTAQVPQSGDVLFSNLNLQAPDILIRNLEAPSSVGIIHAGSETRPYFLLKVMSYQRTFLGMLDWESSMAQDFSEYYPAYATDASNTTNATFSDDLVQSHSVRVLRDAQGRSLMMYGYTANKQVLIIARDEAAYTILLSRLSAGGN